MTYPHAFTRDVLRDAALGVWLYVAHALVGLIGAMAACAADPLCR